jgi:hypothetical protein
MSLDSHIMTKPTLSMTELIQDLKGSIAKIEAACPCMLYGDAMKRELKIILASLEAMQEAKHEDAITI